jgi:hypothetical protein
MPRANSIRKAAAVTGESASEKRQKWLDFHGFVAWETT